MSHNLYEFYSKRCRIQLDLLVDIAYRSEILSQVSHLKGKEQHIKLPQKLCSLHFAAPSNIVSFLRTSGLSL